MSHQEESQSTPALIHMPDGYDSAAPSTSLGIIPENNLLESYTRLSISLEENGLFKVIKIDYLWNAMLWVVVILNLLYTQIIQLLM